MDIFPQQKLNVHLISLVFTFSIELLKCKATQHAMIVLNIQSSSFVIISINNIKCSV